MATLIVLAALLSVSGLCGCATLVTSDAERIANSLAKAILSQNDQDTVREGGPAYLLLFDGLIEADPSNPQLLMSGSSLYVSYATAFVEDPERARRLTDKGFRYSARAICRLRPAACGVYLRPYSEYVDFLATTDRSDVPALYQLGTSWAARIETHRDDWNAIADIPKVEATLRRVVALDETYEDGAAHAYLGALAIIMPPTLGGRPEQARTHFERAIELSGGRNLMIKVNFAERYGRVMFDRDLHDRLLREVLAASPNAPELTLVNTLAKDRARTLLETADDYF